MDSQALRQLFSLANAFKEGDLAIGGTTDDRVRDDARRLLLSTTIGDIRRTTLIDDGVTAALERSRDRHLDPALDGLTIAQVKSELLSSAAAWARAHSRALGSEVIAALVKVMTNDELTSVARAIFNPLNGAIGAPHHFGSRLQPNSPGDDDDEILFSILEGLSYGCGDVILGVNPAADDLDTIVRIEQLLERVVRCLELPTRYCVLSDIIKQHRAQARTRVDVGFQSLAGTSKALAAMAGLDADGLLDLARSFSGLYFETGQGSAVTNGAAMGVDMVTLEARAYGLARCLRDDATAPWMIVNDVAGFIGPEVFATADQLERACLEDIVMAKLHGITMGLDICATFHMGIAPDVLRSLTARIVERAAPAYLMAVPGNADPMLGYLTTSFRDHPRLRRSARRRMTPVMERRLTALGALDAHGDPLPGGSTVARLYAAYARAGGDERADGSLEAEGHRRLHEVRERGFDLGGEDASTADVRIDRLYANARSALYARLDSGVIRDATIARLRARTTAASRDEYVARPAAGEQLRDEDARAVKTLSGSRPQVQVVVSDGLNANAVNEQLRTLLPALRRLLSNDGRQVCDTTVVLENGRVRAGYEVGGLADATIIAHVIGERPGTGLNTLSAYLTYGRDEAGRSRWSRSLEHSATTAVCGIHPKGKPPEAAAAEIARTVARMVEQKRSGVTLLPDSHDPPVSLT